jgi:hypothetical protein
MNTKRTARIAGLLYLIVIVCAGFSEGVVRSSLVVPGDAAATAANIAGSEMLFRAGFVADLVAFLSDLGITVLLYLLLRPVDRTVAMVAAALRLLAHPAIATVNLLNHFAALVLVGDAGYLGAFDPAQLEALALLAMDMHGYGYLIGGAFFGVHLLLLGWLLARSELFPSLLGLLIVAAAGGYIIESFGMFLFPAHESLYTTLVTVTAVLGEVSLALYLLVKGVREAGVLTSAEPVPAGGTGPGRRAV